MKRGVVGSGSAANPNYPGTAAANAELEAKLTGTNTGGAGNATPNEAQVRVAVGPVCMHLQLYTAVAQLAFPACRQ